MRTTLLGDLEGQVQEFADEMGTLLSSTLPNVPDTVVDILSHDARYAVRAGVDGKGVSLYIDGKEVATLKASLLCRLDSVGRYLAVEKSSFVLQANIDRTPVIRFDYMREMNTAPTAHVQIHAHRGALSHLLSLAKHRSPHDISSLHIPVGGSRFRPCLEDMVQFLIQECQFDAQTGWLEHVRDGRERWRRRQAAAVVRDVPDEAVRVLEELGYSITQPVNAKPTSSHKLRAW